MHARHARATRTGIAVALSLVLAGCGAVHASDSAAEKARQLDLALSDAGLPSIDEDTAATLFGTDGGHVCAAANEGADGLARANLLAGSAYRGRPRADVSGTAADYAGSVVSVYCPDALPAFRSYVDGLDLDESR